MPQDDWRRMGQEDYLPPGTSLVWRSYTAPSPAWDHDHCEFCWAKFAQARSPDASGLLTEGWTTTSAYLKGANYHWVCTTCCDDFAEEFGWTLTR